MKLKSNITVAAIAAVAMTLLAGVARADDSQIKITEWMYKSADVANDGIGEFVEISNVGSTAVDLTGWSEDDSTGHPGVHSMSAFGVIAGGESVIMTEISVAAFRTEWNLDPSVKVISYGSKDNLGSSDAINIYNASNQLIDSLTYGSVGPTTSGTSGRPGSAAALGANNSALWVRSTIGDADNSYMSASGSVGSPGFSALAIAAVPEPSGVALVLAGMGVLGFARRGKKGR
jgi:hypothetical protein